MPKKLRIKHRQTGASGPPSTLLNAELAFNEVSGVLYYGKGEAGNGNATDIIAIGGNGAFVAIVGTQTISGNKTFSGTVSAVTPTLTDSSTLVATTEFVKNQSYLKASDGIDCGLLVDAGASADILSTETGTALYTENYAVITI